MIAVGTMLLALQSAANATELAYLTVTGQKQGEIKGSLTTKGHEGAIEVLSVSHSIVSPRDAASGLATGKRMHKPLVITIPLDKSAPLLWNALTQNEALTKFELSFWAPGVNGMDKQEFTIKLTNASVVSIDFGMSPETDGVAKAGTPHETISFVYQKIEWTWVDGGITAMDDWEAPVQ